MACALSISRPHYGALQLADHSAQRPPPPLAGRLQVGGVADYLAGGPGFVFLCHPALGPLWQVVGQKIRGGSLAAQAEVQLEVAEVCLRDVHVQASGSCWLPRWMGAGGRAGGRADGRAGLA